MYAIPALSVAAGVATYLGRPKPISTRAPVLVPDPDTLSEYPKDRKLIWTTDEDVEMPIYLAKKGLHFHYHILI
jgi:hypothetical protein